MKTTITLLLVLIYSTLQAQVLSDSLVSHYPLDFNAKDIVGLNDGVSYGGVTSAINRFGTAKKAYDFDGVNDYIRLNSAFDFPKRTINLWFNADVIDATDRHIYISDNPYLKNGFTQIKIKELNGTKQIRSSAGISGNEGAKVVAEKTWYMITIVVDKDSVRHFLNAESIGRFPKGVVVSNVGESSAILGASRVMDRFFDGKIDDVSIFNKALTKTEIQQLFNERICYQSVTVTDTLRLVARITGFNPVTYENNVKIYPNPTKQSITIQANKLSNGLKVKIVNSLGVTVYQVVLDDSLRTVDVSSLSGKGIYFVYLQTSNNETLDVKKIIVE